MRAEAVSNRGPSAYQPNALPLGQTGSHVLGLASVPNKPVVSVDVKQLLNLGHKVCAQRAGMHALYAIIATQRMIRSLCTVMVSICMHSSDVLWPFVSLFHSSIG